MNYQTMYLVWVNDFLTIAYFAEIFGLSEHRAKVVINKGRVLHHDQLGSK